MKKTYLLAALLLMSGNSFASDICYEQGEGQSKETVDKASKDYEENQDVVGVLMTCAGPILMGMSAESASETSCPDGSKPCKSAVKQLCKVDKGKIKGNGIATQFCLPFSFLLL